MGDDLGIRRPAISPCSSNLLHGHSGGSDCSGLRSPPSEGMDSAPASESAWEMEGTVQCRKCGDGGLRCANALGQFQEQKDTVPAGVHWVPQAKDLETHWSFTV